MINSPESQKAANAKEDGPEKRDRRQRHSFSPEIAKLICDRIAEGWSLRKVCQDANMPARSTIFGWLEEHEEFARQYTLARQIQIEDLWDAYWSPP
jgi:IS30 family transposase